MPLLFLVLGVAIGVCAASIAVCMAGDFGRRKS